MNINKSNTNSIALEQVAVFGANGAIGQAFLKQCLLDANLKHIHSFSRQDLTFTDSRITHHVIDYTSETRLKQAKNSLDSSLNFDLIFVATGALHTALGMPEKSIVQYQKNYAEELYLTNTIVPSLIMKHFYPLLNPSKTSVLACLCARIGSISDNQLGGWYAYRASKAALMMMIKSISIEISRRNKYAICVGLHPGTVDSALSKPFQKNISKKTLKHPNDSSKELLSTLLNLTINDSGKQFAYDGSEIAY